MQRYNNLLELRQNANKLYEELKILQIFVDETVEDIPKTIIGMVCDIADVINNILIIHAKLQHEVLDSKEFPDKRNKVVDFNEIKIKLQEISTCLYFVKLAIENNYNEISYEKISEILEIMLKKSEYVINMTNKTKLKIYPSEKTKRKNTVKDFNFSKYQFSKV